MKIPPIDLSKLLQLLKTQGRAELHMASAPKFGEITRGAKLNNLPLLKEWDNILLVLEKEILPLLGKGCEARALVAPASKLAKSAASLSLMATQILSFVPGPVGIVCSLINAVVCFSTGNIVGGLFELLGCIPGGKVAGKSSSKLFPKIQAIMVDMAKNNPYLAAFVKSNAKAATKEQKVVMEFFGKHARQTAPMPKPQAGYAYGVRSPMIQPKTGNMPSLNEALKTNMSSRSMLQPSSINKTVCPPSTNSMIYRLGTNTGKPQLW